MEFRSLTRCLRSRPTTNILAYQFRRSIPQIQAAHFSSSPSNANDNTTNPPQRTRSKDDISNILNRLNLGSKRSNPRPPTTSQLTSEFFPGQDVAKNNAKSSLNSAAASNREPLVPAAYGRAADRRKVALKLGPTLGREVAVTLGDVEGSIKILHSRLNENNVKFQQLAQKYHVRRGQQKKNLRIKRWRNLFKYSFTHTVNKIQRMRKQGW